MVAILTLRCPGCNARIKAPVQLLGQRRQCPGCKTPFVVGPRVPQDAGPVLVPESAAAATRR
jgi:hypothetical protein